MLYKEFLPGKEIKDKIECYWKFIIPHTKEGSTEPFFHVFPPEGSCSLIFVKLIDIGKQYIIEVGPSNSIPKVQVYPNSVIFGIRLIPGFSSLLITEHPRNIINKSKLLSFNQYQQWQNLFLEKLSFEDPDLEDLNQAIAKHNPSNFQSPDRRIINAINFIILRKGQVSLEEVASVANLSERQLQRLFLRSLGISVKQFSQIRRFRNAIIELYIKKKSFSDISDIGYVDSAHFYKSFRNLGKYDVKKFLSHIETINHIFY